MVKKCYLVLILLVTAITSFAQNTASDNRPLELIIKDGRAYVIHNVKAQEDLYTIGNKYAVPTVVLCQHNNLTINDTLKPNLELLIPIGNFNFHKEAPYTVEYKALTFKRTNNETNKAIANALHVEEYYLITWNPSINYKANTGAISCGWITYKTGAKTGGIKVTDITPQKPVTTVPSSTTNTTATDTSKAKLTDLELIFNYQTSNGLLLDSSSGMVVFFKPQTSVNNDMLFAFSNEVPKGKVIKIVNPSNKKFVFAKVIGNLPNTKQYLNARLGVDGRARSILETREVKLWCDYFLKY